MPVRPDDSDPKNPVKLMKPKYGGREPDGDDGPRGGFAAKASNPKGRSRTEGREAGNSMAAMSPAFPRGRKSHPADSRRDLGKKPY